MRARRAEAFGAIIQLKRPRALVFVNRAMARELGMNSDQWKGNEPKVGDRPLSAPLEAHLQLTNRCDVGCQGCYTGASPTGHRAEWGPEQWERAIDHLADAGVFHLALGGGESAPLPWLGRIAQHARDRGLVPNLTTSGLMGLDALTGVAHLFGQINVSLDGIGEVYAAVRGVDGFAGADRAIRRLRAVKREVGINVVVTRDNFSQLGELFAYARRRGLNEVELLRFKPSGRGAARYRDLVCTDAQHRKFLPLVLAAARRAKIRVRVDCSYVPMLAHHKPSRALLAGLAVYGCTAGDFLVAAKANGAMTGCSFAPPPPSRPQLSDLAAYWQTPHAFSEFRSWRAAREPCRSCPYHDLCRGGCKVVSGHVLGDPTAPDPECPRVIDFMAERKDARNLRLPVVL